ncbi:Elongation factor P--(R)-beta-lysine ligase [Arsenophonus endosymbiont of Aleurodicus dispersus]|uniref:elongation factor P--(R)-beta-lysine ligase n=1 Tax=Arsenophonus endosymbiont of Aleurodicus dispersus TaxID=235559 RepID=UPI000EB42D31|nr:elongation factor P--(R)-beta-lysine ligase [Arsenophonus endosymbiont of Aleurodicus dispersus]VAY02511.1 Elongation factor P--(R)-beta-lysine ligase [Arsenophonus endosymbiont of Aleurodicus dispersus]
MSEIVNWQPSASINNLFKRTKIIAEIRRFFIERGVVEVETPILGKSTVTDINISPFETQFFAPVIADSTKLYMITSPEYHMKRLLAADSGPIYQIIKAFRNEEKGRYHNPEFTILEWYRPHYDMYRLIDEVDDLLQLILDCQPTERISYQQVFQHYLNIDPLALESESKQLHDSAVKFGLNNTQKEENKDVLLQFLFTMGVEPNLGKDKPTVIYHFPASQAALAKISKEDHRVADRFEVYFKGIELANGFRELTDAQEQRERFDNDNQMREKMGLPEQPIDEYFLTALDKISPYCSGVALGIDRLVMLVLHAEKISDVISFSIERA